MAAAQWTPDDARAMMRACMHFVRHLLSPVALCPLGVVSCRTQMLAATRLFITTMDDGFDDLPAPATFGPLPALPFLPELPSAAPNCNDTSASFWDAVTRHMPPVPQGNLGEAEAPWVPPGGRVSARRRALA